MAFIRVEDETGSLDLIVFPKIFSQTKDIWVDNHPILISGKVDTRDDTLAVIVEAIETKDTIKAKGSNQNYPGEHLFIKIPVNTKVKQLKALRVLLLEHTGLQKVSLIFKDRNNQKIDLKQTITWSEVLARSIAQVLDVKSVVEER